MRNSDKLLIFLFCFAAVWLADTPPGSGLASLPLLYPAMICLACLVCHAVRARGHRPSGLTRSGLLLRECGC
ncbi:hypothetical protein BOX15_Mlig028071g1 [Macrostomum lignano]|uniref:DUF2933 domain-containing protein n=1 Tax=Macrostomum lignano TaxID=282301 RepID=A0A267F910_9PLAT|nr:hypothetical protein BOX15_Mlig028071g1 [Macrostomum lignano]